MTLWFGLALMTAAAILAVLWPLARRASPWRSGSDVAIYRDQLDEIERDRAAGLIEDNEAASAQVEVSRRLIAAADAQSAPQSDVPSAGGRDRGAGAAAVGRNRTLSRARVPVAAGSAAGTASCRCPRRSVGRHFDCAGGGPSRAQSRGRTRLGGDRTRGT